MKKTITITGLVLVISLFSYNMLWVNYLLMLIIVLALIFLILIALVSIFKIQNSQRFKIPLWIIIICLAGIITSLFRPYDEATIESDNPGRNLEYAYKTDQADRQELRSFVSFMSNLEERDHERLEQVRKLYSQDKISTPMDKFHAAFVFHHSDNSNDYRIASQLAADAAQNEALKDNYTVQWLQKASYDRYMLSIGKPEKYNTQNTFSLDVN